MATLLVVELKHGVLHREHVGQVVDYLDDVERRYAGRHVELMVVANVIPPQRRTKLERVGVNFKEIPEEQFREVAKKHGVILSEPSMVATLTPRSTPLPRSTLSERVPVGRESSANELVEVDRLVSELIRYGERWVSNFGEGLKVDLEHSNHQWLSRKRYAQLSRWCNPERWSSREQWVHPRARRISQLLLGRVIEREQDVAL